MKILNFKVKFKIPFHFIVIVYLGNLQFAKATPISESVIPATAPCIDQPNDVLLPVFGECTQFYGCKNGKAILRHCMEGLYFDPETKNCTEASQSNCIQEQSIPITSMEKLSEVTEVPRYLCLGKAIGSLVPSRTNCSEYYSCISSNPHLMTCGIQSHFDSFSQKCISPELSNCVTRTRAPVKTTRKPKLIETVCKGMFDGEKYPVPGNCSKYYECLGHKAYVKSCGVKHFYPMSRTCIDAEVSECFEGNVRVKSVSTESYEIEDIREVDQGDEGIASTSENGPRMDCISGVKDCV